VESPAGKRSGRGEERDHHPVDYHQQTSRETNERSSAFPEQHIRDELIGLDWIGLDWIFIELINQWVLVDPSRRRR
jgi:hypothetical protein